ncbi:tripartite tricarboxylate transporter substrate binding protein [Microbacterium sp. cf332]|uniref:tripartite tricarboxylate transporter substrate binding protein n=1 Tax=Microbacterium sp. cf332 TaxID=1761804 RepID=UPI00088F2B7C|nr:tripartite tricarboxylate transporter substrate binding protein [Microbacterium sp. cf332]SDQ54471.1 Tripartite-type tricarboxylate transporter, receptor component TctC [Microbacterium sp. cf332]
MRKTLIAGLASLTLASVVLSGCAQRGNAAGAGGDEETSWPEKPITLIVAFDPGGSSDVGARLLADALEEELDATIVVENRPGAGGQIGYTALAGADPDGYTFGLTTIPGVIVSALDESRGAAYTPEDFAPAALQVTDPTAIAVAPDSPYESLDDLLAAAEAAPDTITASTTGIGSQDHFGLLLLNEAAGVDIRPVHFADGAAQATTAFLGGNVDVLVGNVGDVKQLEESGSARVLTVLADERSPFLPDVPTAAEAGYDVELGSARGYAFPADTPDEIVQKLSDAIGEVMQDDGLIGRMEDLGLQPTYQDSTDYAAFWAERTETLAGLVDLVRENG